MTSNIFGRITLHDTEMAELQKMAHVDYPFSGKARGVLQIGGTWGAPRGAGQVQPAGCGVFTANLWTSLNAVVMLAGGELALDRLRSPLTALMRVDGLPTTGRQKHFAVDLQGSGLELARLRRIQTSRLFLSGRVDFDLAGNGTLSQPSLGGKIDVHSIALNGERLGGLHVEAGDSPAQPAHSKPPPHSTTEN